MIRLNVSLLLEVEENRKPLIENALELVDKSVDDKGCIGYDLYGSLTQDNHLMIVETWENRHDLEDHMNSDHFKLIVPRLESLCTMTLEEFEF